ncbi:conserved hypothetical protein [Neospora caninum Liverpool]|uniref:Uncharacterized protein n=1 Tax=Neospora caninum (strain Liverpool) TaxID=572307 RepID=F0VAC5_NEOCL|nr:conserved hypothetical protein [Neospora caninum Liverpool]CBZ50614.1 conserved hypothetical protein [Neospora caninum Liverpool]CEL65226.1 TPA: hypothetical protein BN1204_010820 [Neospora caninum Liverpool]|eukprot:XP_003880647.1 conserved hypothetical protein [Neospora caninum Liverpool]
MESYGKGGARGSFAPPFSAKRAVSQSGGSSQCLHQKASITHHAGRDVLESCAGGAAAENLEPRCISSAPQTEAFEALYEISFGGTLVHRYLKIRFHERHATECLAVLRDSTQVARLMVLLGESRIMACPVDANTILMAYRTDPLKTQEDFNSFWFFQHGYKLPSEATKTIVKVSFGYLTLHYPVGCCWRSKLIELPHVTNDVRRIIATKVFKTCADLQVIEDASLKLLSVRQSLRVSAACLQHARDLLRTIKPTPESEVTGTGKITWERDGEICDLENQSQVDALDKLNMKLEHRRRAPIVLPVRPPENCLIPRDRSDCDASSVNVIEQLNSFKFSEGDRTASDAASFKKISVSASGRKRIRRVLPPPATYSAGHQTNYRSIDSANNRTSLTHHSRCRCKAFPFFTRNVLSHNRYNRGLSSHGHGCF